MMRIYWFDERKELERKEGEGPEGKRATYLPPNSF